MNKNPKAFVLMPFDPEFSSIYEGLIKLALEDAGYDVARADSFLDQKNILRDIIRGIATAHLIVADLTTLNPNVLYELGLCHGLRIPTILLAQSTEEVPFDLRSYRIQLYSTRFDKVHRLKQPLKEVAERHKLQEIMFGSPVTDFLPEGYASIRKVPEISAEEPAEKVPEEVEEEKGFLDFILEGTQAAEEMTHMMSVISEETVSISRKIEEHAARIQALAKKPGPGTAAQAHKIASIAARDMNRYLGKIEEHLPTLEDSIDLFVESFSGYANWVEPRTEEDRKQVAEFRRTIDDLLEGAIAGLEGTRSYRDAVAGLKGISREINRASRRLTLTLEGLISTVEKIEAFCLRTLPLIDEKLGNQFEPEGGTGA